MKAAKTIKDLRSFLLLWGSQTVSALGTAMTEYALVIWVYEKEGTASSVTLLTICIFLPTILFRFAGGALADRRDKKRIMLIADLFAACGTAAVFVLHAFSALRVWNLYLINVLLSFMNAVQEPASFVATSLLVPKEHYTRASGMQSLSGAAIGILAPALGALLLSFGGLSAVLICDLGSFSIAIVVLLFFIRIPKTDKAAEEVKTPFLRSCTEGFRWLRGHKEILFISLFMMMVNLLAKLGDDGMIAPFVLARTGNDAQALGAVQSFIAVGVLIGSMIVTGMKPVKNKPRLIFLLCSIVFTGNIVLGLSFHPWIWCAAVLYSYMAAAIMGANLTAYVRERVPIEVQGRVFSAKDTIQNGAIPPGLFLGGVLADRVFEPFMASESPIQRFLAPFFGTGKGAGIAVIFCIVGVLGIALSLTCIAKPVFRHEEELSASPREEEQCKCNK